MEKISLVGNAINIPIDHMESCNENPSEFSKIQTTRSERRSSIEDTIHTPTDRPGTHQERLPGVSNLVERRFTLVPVESNVLASGEISVKFRLSEVVKRYKIILKPHS